MPPPVPSLRVLAKEALIRFLFDPCFAMKHLPLPDELKTELLCDLKPLKKKKTSKHYARKAALQKAKAPLRMPCTFKDRLPFPYQVTCRSCKGWTYFQRRPFSDREHDRCNWDIYMANGNCARCELTFRKSLEPEPYAEVKYESNAIYKAVLELQTRHCARCGLKVIKLDSDEEDEFNDGRDDPIDSSKAGFCIVSRALEPYMWYNDCHQGHDHGGLEVFVRMPNEEDPGYLNSVCLLCIHYATQSVFDRDTACGISFSQWRTIEEDRRKWQSEISALPRYYKYE